VVYEGAAEDPRNRLAVVRVLKFFKNKNTELGNSIILSIKWSFHVAHP
jgi:hypothetical protein